MAWTDEADEEWVDEEDDSEGELLSCPSCRCEVHEDTQQCPHCGEWITPVDPRDRPRLWLWTVVVAALIVSMFVFLVR